MDIKICSLLVAVFSLQLPVSLCSPRIDFCPGFTATFVAVIDQRIGTERLSVTQSRPFSRTTWASEMLTFSMFLTMP